MFPILNVFKNIWEWLNNLLAGLKFNELVSNLFEKYIANLDEFIKWMLALLLLVIIIFGTVSLIKKTFKFLIVIGVIILIIILVRLK